MSVVSFCGSVFQTVNPTAVIISPEISQAVRPLAISPKGLDDDSDDKKEGENDDIDTDDDGFGDDEIEQDTGFQDGLDDEEVDEFDDIDEDDFDDDFDDDFEEELADDYEVEINDEVSAESGLGEGRGKESVDDGLDDFEDFEKIE